MLEVITTTLMLSCGQVVDHRLIVKKGGSIIGEQGCTVPPTVNILRRDPGCVPKYVYGAHEAREPDVDWYRHWDGSPFPVGAKIVGNNSSHWITAWTPPETPEFPPRIGMSWFAAGLPEYYNRTDEWYWDGTKVVADKSVTWTCDVNAIEVEPDVDNAEIANVRVIGGPIVIHGQHAHIHDVEVANANFGIAFSRPDKVIDAVIERAYVHDVLKGGILVWGNKAEVKQSTIINVGDPWDFSATWPGIRVGRDSKVMNNVVANAGKDGIFALYGSEVAWNTVSRYCTVIGDAGGIYMTGQGGGVPDRVYVHNNLVEHGHGFHDYIVGYTNCAGLYADTGMKNVVGYANTIRDVDTGVHIDISFNNMFFMNTCTNCANMNTSNKSSKNIVEWK